MEIGIPKNMFDLCMLRLGELRNIEKEAIG
jgi:hypothetical protein